MKLELLRTYYPKGTNGILMQDDLALCQTIELPWKNNLPKFSCIPEGEYFLEKRYSNKFKWHFQVMHVPHRQLILIHPANNAKLELRGCIAPISSLIGQGCGTQSRVAFKKLYAFVMRALEINETVYLTIKKNEHDKTGTQ